MPEWSLRTSDFGLINGVLRRCVSRRVYDTGQEKEKSPPPHHSQQEHFTLLMMKSSGLELKCRFMARVFM